MIATINHTLNQLYQLSNFEVRRKAAYNQKNYNLKNICRILSLLGNPQNTFKSIHVAGSKGKGSVVHYLAFFLTKLGYKTGHTLSPHIIDERDRFYVNGKKISFTELNSVTKKILLLVNQNNLNPTVFDVFTAIAFEFFKKNQIEIAVVETGLGGRWDSTNILSAKNILASIITQIDKEHTVKLGNTLKKIAMEKAGIIKKQQPIFFLQQNSTVNQVIINTAKEKKSPLFPLKKINPCLDQNNPSTNLTKSFPFLTSALKKNLSLVLLVMEKLNYSIKPSLFWKILKKDLTQNAFLGRYQKINNLILDGGHTPLSMKNLAESIKQDKSLNHYRKINLIFYVLEDKNIPAIITHIPVSWQFYFFNPQFFYIPIHDLEKTRKKIQRTLKKRFNEIKKISELKIEKKKQELFIISGSFRLIGWFLREEIIKKSKYRKLFLK